MILLLVKDWWGVNVLCVCAMQSTICHSIYLYFLYCMRSLMNSNVLICSNGVHWYVFVGKAIPYILLWEENTSQNIHEQNLCPWKQGVQVEEDNIFFNYMTKKDQLMKWLGLLERHSREASNLHRNIYRGLNTVGFYCRRCHCSHGSVLWYLHA